MQIDLLKNTIKNLFKKFPHFYISINIEMINRIVAYVNFYFPTYKSQFYPDNFIKACLVYQFLYAKYFTQKLDLNQIIYRLIDYKHLVLLFENFGKGTNLAEDVFILSILLLKNLKYLAI